MNWVRNISDLYHLSIGSPRTLQFPARSPLIDQTGRLGKVSLKLLDQMRVMAAQSDLVEVVATLKQILCVKG